MKESEAQKRARVAYENANIEYTRFRKAFSSAKSFIRNKADKESLDELETLIAERRKTL